MPERAELRQSFWWAEGERRAPISIPGSIPEDQFFHPGELRLFLWQKSCFRPYFDSTNYTIS